MCTLKRKNELKWFLAHGCIITKSGKFKGVWILSIPTVYLFKLCALHGHDTSLRGHFKGISAFLLPKNKHRKCSIASVWNGKAPFCSAPCFFFSHLIRLTLHDQNNRIHPIKTWFDDISSLQKQKSSFQVSLRLLSLSHYFSFSSIWPSRITL